MGLRYINGKARWKGEPINEIRHPLDIETKWTTAELTAVGLEVIPPPAKVKPTKVTITFEEFMDLFTPAEQEAIARAYSVSNNWRMKLWYDKAVATNAIDLKSPKVSQGLNVLVAGGLLTIDRVSEILAGQAQEV